MLSFLVPSALQTFQLVINIIVEQSCCLPSGQKRFPLKMYKHMCSAGSSMLNSKGGVLESWSYLFPSSCYYVHMWGFE
jgi:hypothetical protein